MNVFLRDYRSADHAACLAIFASNVPDYFHPEEGGELETFLRALPGPYYVIEDELGRVVACGGIAIAPGSPTADLCWGMVARDHQGKGIGRVLTQARLDRIRQEPRIAHVALNTSQHTRQFYERLGFRTERVVPNGYGYGLDRCEMRLPLAPVPVQVGAALER